MKKYSNKSMEEILQDHGENSCRIRGVIREGTTERNLPESLKKKNPETVTGRIPDGVPGEKSLEEISRRIYGRKLILAPVEGIQVES